MQQNIAELIDGILEREGGYVDHPSDPGGKTNWGITERVARAMGYRGHMRNLPQPIAREIYYQQYIVKPGFLPVAETDLVVGEELIDSGVNAGPARSAKWFQQSLNILNRRQRDYSDIAVDGDIGPATMRAFQALRQKRGYHTRQILMKRCLDGLQFGHYYNLAEDNSKFEDFMPGWVAGRIGNSDHNG